MKNGGMPGEDEYKDKEFLKTKGIIFLEDDVEFFLLRVHQYASFGGFATMEIRSEVVFEYALDRNVDKLQLFEMVHNINGKVNEYNSKNSQNKSNR